MSDNIDRSYELIGYTGSRDYERLAELAKKQSIICLVDYTVHDDQKIRDVARTQYMRRVSRGDELWYVNSRGYGHITAFNKREFISFCEHLNLEFLEPNILVNDE